MLSNKSYSPVMADTHVHLGYPCLYAYIFLRVFVDESVYRVFASYQHKSIGEQLSNDTACLRLVALVRRYLLKGLNEAGNHGCCSLRLPFDFHQGVIYPLLPGR